MDSKILKASILNGAIELLPENLSTLAIIPLQMRLVYQIGQSYGYQLDSGHIKDFLATLGVGLTSQYLEQAGRKLLGGLLGKVGGGGALSPYASLIHDVFTGDRSLFTTAEGLRAAFAAFAPLQGPDRPAPEPYEPGSWGPVGARRLAEPYHWVLGE